MKVIVALIIASTCAEALALAGGASRVVFVRNSQIYTASEDGSQLRQLTTDAKTKQYPKWSPDGTRIAYLTEGDMSKDPKSRAKIEVISVSGEHLGTAPVLVTDADGTLVQTSLKERGPAPLGRFYWNDGNVPTGLNSGDASDGLAIQLGQTFVNSGQPGANRFGCPNPIPGNPPGSAFGQANIFWRFGL